ncbi:UNVERIFIED_ORG: hypothetical protein ABID33_002603 [Xanthobacter viscosus]|jgi:hypothetical protein|uniref:Uncharacterized protein n=1 Tax=Xanthobacter autotrophicus TaxID=280 RepID=A0A6C1KBZ0_XANAU|nr:hypothetical protein [Xanthobacter autotrophicus]TLX41775.1 hypothetical protein FBQ73_16800 [Xanthobacter autotrophicus]
MPKPAAAANATTLPVTTRRAFLKAGGALGTVAALAMPVAVLPKVEAAAAGSAALTSLWPERLRLKAEAEKLKAIHDAAKARYNALKPPLPKEARAHPALFGYGVEWQETRQADGSCIIWGDGAEWREIAAKITGATAAAFKAGCLRRAEVMDAYNRHLCDLWEQCGLEEAWDAWDVADTALTDIERRILALPATDFSVAARQSQILRHWGCGEDDEPLTAFFERIEQAAARAGDRAFAVGETA